jgi:hypothetical protein
MVDDAGIRSRIGRVEVAAFDRARAFALGVGLRVPRAACLARDALLRVDLRATQHASVERGFALQEPVALQQVRRGYSGSSTARSSAADAQGTCWKVTDPPLAQR